MANAKEPVSIIPLLSRALHRIRSTPPRVIASPATQPRRAAVALVIRVTPPSYYVPSPNVTTESSSSPTSHVSPTNLPPPTLTEFFQLDWVKAPGASAEILFLRRDKPNGAADEGHSSGSRAREAHVAFPGGKSEEGDEGGLYTAMRQTWEEIGLDLAESAYTPIGQLDDREVTTSLGKRLLMVLSPFVFLQLTPYTTPVDPAPGTTLHWVPLVELLPPDMAKSRKGRKSADAKAKRSPRWSSVTVDASSRLAPRNSTVIRLLVRALVGSMQFPALVITPSVTASASAYLSDEKTIDARRAGLEHAPASAEALKLWGLSLGMTLDLLSYMVPPRSGADGLLPPDGDADMMRVPVVAPSLTSVFPRFSYPDVNFWIWVFGKRYREVIKGWEASVQAGGVNDRRINWTGSALTTFYAAVRKALIVVLVARAILVLAALFISGWIMFIRS